MVHLKHRQSFARAYANYFQAGIIAFSFIVSSSVQAIKSPEDEKEFSRIQCLWHLESPAYRIAALERIEEQAVKDNGKALSFMAKAYEEGRQAAQDLSKSMGYLHKAKGERSSRLRLIDLQQPDLRYILATVKN